MKIKELIKSYSFWTALAGALVVLISVLGDIFGFTVKDSIVSEVVMAIAGILVVFGVVTMPISKDDITDDKTDDENDDNEIK